jgi:hypothetical protein
VRARARARANVRWWWRRRRMRSRVKGTALAANIDHRKSGRQGSPVVDGIPLGVALVHDSSVKEKQQH